MPQLAAAMPYDDPAIVASIYDGHLQKARWQQWLSVFWTSRDRFATLREKLGRTLSLLPDWDTYGAAPPNDLARVRANGVLAALESQRLVPSHLMPSAEGGIAISFVEGDRRAEIEIYNTGEIAAVTYASEGEPIAWEVTKTGTPFDLRPTIEQIRAHLNA